MANMKPLGNVILTCSGYKTEQSSDVEGISIASFADFKGTIAILRKAADLLEESPDSLIITSLY